MTELLPSTLARRASRCPVCAETIEVGDAIVFLEFDQEWVHEECADE